MKVVFMGTPAIAVPSLERLLTSDHEVAAVLTRPDKPAGRRRVPMPSAVKDFAILAGLPVWQPLKAREAIDDIRAAGAGVIVVVAYGGWLPPAVLDAAPHGCVNVHPSLLPRWRGAAPVERAIMAGDCTTGVTTMQIDEGLDTGPIFYQEECRIYAHETAGELACRLAEIGADLLLRTIDAIEAGTTEACPQSQSGVTYAEKLDADHCVIDWSADAATVDGLIRGANPRPGAWTLLDGRRLKLWRSRVTSDTDPDLLSGTVVSAGPLVVRCGIGTVELLEVQPEGGPRMTAEAFCRGHALERAVLG